MRAGAPLICSRGAGASDLVEDGVNGYTFEAGNAAELADRLATLLALPAARRTELGRAGFETVRQTLAPERIARAKAGLYETLARTTARSELAPGMRTAMLPESDAVHPLGFLDHLPLRAIVEYAARRARRRYLSW
jgi:hypothetical protein